MWRMTTNFENPEHINWLKRYTRKLGMEPEYGSGIATLKPGMECGIGNRITKTRNGMEFWEHLGIVLNGQFMI